jgi:hemerythrin-like domain-containing protein
MTKILDELRDDHRNMARVFDLLGRELNTFKEGGRPDYDLVENILEYCLQYPDLCHHPKEDLIFEKLQDRDPATANIIGNLKLEHEELSTFTWRFSSAVRNVLDDETLPRDWFLDVANDYLSFSRRHMQKEEILFFPAARKTLAPEDWAELDDTWEMVEDPLFGEEIQKKYEGLYQEIMNWEGRSQPQVRTSR